jgi:hypothetical protein
MKLAFILPSDLQRQRIGEMREHMLEMRPDQIKHLEHLLRSWRIFGAAGDHGIAMTRRAIKRVLRDRP